MTISVGGPSMSHAWLAALEATLAAGGKAVNVVSSWPGIEEEEKTRIVLDDFIGSRPASAGKKKDWPRWPVETVANTIFPIELYDGTLDDPFAEFSELYLEGRTISKLVSPDGEYCERLVEWMGPDGEPINQLAVVAKKLRRYRKNHFSSVYEVAIEDPHLDLRTQMPGRNGDPYGFPCLSHMSLTVVDDTLHLTAMYRNQHLVRKAYGNYLGLSRLAWALADHADLGLGEIAVVATHADTELGSAKGLGKRAIEQLVADVKAVLE